jgi:hypothetical protein
MYAATPKPLFIGAEASTCETLRSAAACANLNLDQAPLLVLVIVPVVA